VAFATATNWVFVGEGEAECTSELTRGQFSIFGAIEEIRSRGFMRMITGEE